MRPDSVLASQRLHCLADEWVPSVWAKKMIWRARGQQKKNPMSSVIPCMCQHVEWPFIMEEPGLRQPQAPPKATQRICQDGQAERDPSPYAKTWLCAALHQEWQEKRGDSVVEDATGPGLSGAERSGPTLVLLGLPAVRDFSNPSRSSCHPRTHRSTCWAYLRRPQIPPHTQQRTTA